MTVAIAHVFAVPAQCQAHHGECHINVYGPKQILSPESRLCCDCLFVDAINALSCSLFHRCFFRRWYRGCNVNRIAIAISWIALGIFVFSRCGGYEKAVDFFLSVDALRPIFEFASLRLRCFAHLLSSLSFVCSLCMI